jgi:hypothetical protein
MDDDDEFQLFDSRLRGRESKKKGTAKIRELNGGEQKKGFEDKDTGCHAWMCRYKYK